MAVAELLGIREYARHRGVSPAAVRKAISTGRIADAVTEVDGNPKINPEAADGLWTLNTQPRNQQGGAAPSFQQARAVRETFRAKLARLEFEEKTSTLLNAADVEREAFEIGKQVKTALMALPPRLAELVAAEDDPARCRQLLEEEIRQALETLTE